MTRGTLPGAPPFYSVDSPQSSSSVHSITDRRIEECNMFICNSMENLMDGGRLEEECNMCIHNSEGDCCSVEGRRQQNIVCCKVCIRNKKYVTETQHYTSWVRGHTKTTQKYNIDVYIKKKMVPSSICQLSFCNIWNSAIHMILKKGSSFRN